MMVSRREIEFEPETRLRRPAAALVAVLIVLGGGMLAQASQSDLQSRAGTSLNLNLPKKWAASFEYQHRMVDDLSTYRGSYFTLETGYRFMKRIEALASYRLALVNDWKSHRYALGMKFRAKSGRWRFDFRPMIQHRTKVIDDDETGGEGATFLRTRLRVERALHRKLDVYAAVEPFFAFAADYPIDNWRNTLGLQYECARDIRLDLYYIHRPDYGKSYNRVFHVIGIALDFKAKISGR